MLSLQLGNQERGRKMNQANDWIDLLSDERGSETEKAVQFNFDRTHGQCSPEWVWIPKSCIRVVTRGNYQVTQIKTHLRQKR